jgi:sporulation and spore germination protein
VKRTVLLVVTSALLASCAPQGVQLVPRSELPADVYGRPEDPPPVDAQGIPDEGLVFLLNKGRLTSVPRALPPAVSLPEALVVALLEGPAQPFDTAIPQNTRLISIQVELGIATVNLSAEFESGATGVPLAQKLAQIVYTLTEEGTEIVGVLFQIEGEQIGVLTGNGVVVADRPVSREDYERFAPAPPTKPGGKASPSPSEP